MSDYRDLSATSAGVGPGVRSELPGAGRGGARPHVGEDRGQWTTSGRVTSWFAEMRRLRW